MHRMLVLAVLATALAGCADEAPPAPQDVVVPEQAPAIVGIVQTTEFEPLADALVVLRGEGRDATTGADGSFRFEVAAGTYLVDVGLAGFENATLRAVVTDSDVALDVQLRQVEVTEAFDERFHFAGHMACAAEYVIISGGCDAALTSDQTLGMDPVFEGNNTFEVDVRTDWRTVVVDVVFDPDAQPGLDGLRTVVSGANADRALQDYEQYGRFNDSASYTFHLEPGQEYPEGIVPVPENATTMRLEVLPHSHAWHAVCAPDDTCLLGVGAGTDVAFDVYVTVFYGDAAPAGFSLR